MTDERLTYSQAEDICIAAINEWLDDLTTDKPDIRDLDGSDVFWLAAEIVQRFAAVTPIAADQGLPKGVRQDRSGDIRDIRKPRIRT